MKLCFPLVRREPACRWRGALCTKEEEGGHHVLEHSWCNSGSTNHCLHSSMGLAVEAKHPEPAYSNPHCPSRQHSRRPRRRVPALLPPWLPLHIMLFIIPLLPMTLNLSDPDASPPILQHFWPVTIPFPGQFDKVLPLSRFLYRWRFLSRSLTSCLPRSHSSSHVLHVTSSERLFILLLNCIRGPAIVSHRFLHFSFTGLVQVHF